MQLLQQQHCCGIAGLGTYYDGVVGRMARVTYRAGF